LAKEVLPSLHITPKKSTLLILFIVVVHVCAASVLFFLPLEYWMQLLALLAVMVSLIQALCTHVFRTNDAAIKSAEWGSKGEWVLLTANGNKVAAQLQVSSYVQPWIIILNFSMSRFRRRSLILLPDTVDPELLRCLRVRLKLLGNVDAVV